MCGFVGAVGERWSRPDAAEAIRRLADTLRHRGPDDAGVWTDAELRVALGHRRLAVLDPSAAAHQPMVSADGRFVLMTNGEIYNFGELRSELEKAGYRFSSSGDTEVLLAALIRWGVPSALERCRGMFAVALVDRLERQLWLARDRFGEKPLYVGAWNGQLMFASELRALRRSEGFPTEIDANAVGSLLSHLCIHDERSIFTAVRCVEPGTAVRFSLDAPTGDGVVARYFDPHVMAAEAAADPTRLSFTDAVDDLDARIRHSVSEALVSDVPVGAFLSGGVDSTIVVAHAAALCGSLDTFTIGFDQPSDETAAARSIAQHLGTNHHEFVVSGAEALSLAERLGHIFDEPFADSSQIPTYLVSDLARRHSTVALSGDGGDELFGGYPRFALALHAWSRAQRVPAPLRRATRRVGIALGERAGGLRSVPFRHAERVSKLLRIGGAPTLDDVYREFVTSYAERLPIEAVGPRVLTLPAATSDLNALLLRETTTYLRYDILVKLDRSAMANSLETRVPLLAESVFEFSCRLNDPWKVASPDGHKVALRALADRYVPSVLRTPRKTGFGAPIGAWLRGPLRPFAEDLLSHDRFAAHGLIDEALVRRLWAEHLRGRRDWSARLWSVISFHAWYDEWM